MEVKLWENSIPYLDEGADTPNSMTTYFVESDKPLPCVVVLPGGGYVGRAKHEGEPIAKFFNTFGMNAVVVNYRVSPNRYPSQLADAQRAIKILRSKAVEWNVDPSRIVSLGFSAGGHLSGACATLDDCTICRKDADEIDRFDARPNGAILCYAALSFEKGWGNYPCGETFLGKERCKLESEYFTIQNRVTDKTPPIFMWQTSDDPVVNVLNALTFGKSLRDHNVPFELHIYPHGPHGIGNAAEYQDSCCWMTLAAEWINRNIKSK